ncbi:UvrD-helicase domain-containing protein [Paraburkholderia caffeinilytica]|uniref:UvrD-helicase domain-containing protein n=1 Tax=Paraburkholderia caffeinilytica TaxID=1761016 RepID=UPI0038BB26BC
MSTKNTQPSPLRLTAEQLAIINTTESRVLVEACPGSSKTYTLCAHTRRSIDRGTQPQHILTLSFSNAAVDVLTQRLPAGVKAQTFHAFGLDVVRRTVAKGSAMPALLTPKRSAELLLKALKASPDACRSVHKKTGIALKMRVECARLAAFFKQCNGSDEVAARLARDDAPDFAAYVDVLAELRVVRIAYDKLVKRAGCIDYPAMLRRACSMIDTVALPFTHLLVDEAQDMNAEQARLLAALARRVPHIMVFGDANQAVFGFAGGKMHDMRKVLGDVVTMRLTRSFRLTHENVALANAVLGGSERGMRGDRHGVTPSLVHCASAVDQEDAVVRRVKELITSGVPANHIAILGRTKAQVRLVEQALLAVGYETESGFSPRLPEHVDRTLDVLALVQTCIATAKAGRKPKRASRANRLGEIVGKTVKRKALDDCLRLLVKAARIPSFEGRYLMASRIYLRLAKAAGDIPENLAAELGRWQATSRRFTTVRPLRAHILNLREQTPVVTSTIHGAKGSEWAHVLVLGVTEGSIPFYREINKDEVDEERRVFYVAVTRAREQLHLFHAPFHHAPSRQSFAQPSQFLTRKVLEALSHE